MVNTKLALYVFIATMTAFLAHFGAQVVDKGIENLGLVSGVVWVLIIGNTLLQGAIAWKSYTSDSPEQKEKEQALLNTLIHQRNTINQLKAER